MIPPRTRNFVRLLLIFLMAAWSVAMGAQNDRQRSLSAWLVEWDADAGLREAAALSDVLASFSAFAVSFGDDDLPRGECADPLLRSPVIAPFFLTVVNDVQTADGNVVLKDPDLVTRFLATREARDRHRETLLSLVEGGAFAGLELDYERVRMEDWKDYLEFCEEMAAALTVRGMRLRVVLEPKPYYFQAPLPSGIEYSVMAYNLHGPHSGPGPKATPAFLARLAGQCRRAGAEARLAVATGGFVWRGDGKTVGITEAAAAETARVKRIIPERDSESRYLHYRYEDDGVACETWYADATTLDFLLAAAAEHGFRDVDLWRLGGNTRETLDMLRECFSRRDGAQVWFVGPEQSCRTLREALACAVPGDSIIVSPGNYRESVRVLTPGLTILGSPDPQSAANAVTVTGTVRDGMNTVWQGITFQVARDGSPLLELDMFSGRFEKCVFVMENHDGDAAIRVHAGRPTFSRCIFRGGGDSPGLFLHSITLGAVRPRAITEFAYCLFSGFRNDVVEITEEMDLRFANCLFTGNRRLVRRFARFRGMVELVNSVFYFNTGQFITNRTADASLIRIANCLTTPYLTPRFGSGLKSLAEQPGVKAEDCLTAAPRFHAADRLLPVNLGIDELMNLERASAMAHLADEFGVPLTFAVETAGMEEPGWRTLEEMTASGHEIASLTGDRVAMQPEPPLAIGYRHPGGRATSLSVDGGRLIVYVDDAVLGEAECADATIAGLARELRRMGVQAVASPHFSRAPALLLEETTRLNIGYPSPSVPLFLDANAYFVHEIADSARVLKHHLPKQASVFSMPYGGFSPRVHTDVAAAGFVAMRTGIGLGDDAGSSPNVSLSGIPVVSGITLSTIRSMVPALSLGENVRLALAYAAETLSALSLHTSRPDDIEKDEWREILKILASDETIEPLTLAGIAQLNANASTLGKPVKHEALRYRPVNDSPMVGRGRSLGFVRDFAGRPLPADKPPSIGLFEPE